MSSTKPEYLRTMTPIRAEIIGSNTCTALGITAAGQAPVLALCRKLVEADYEPTTPLEAWRGNILCLKVRSIGEAARLEINAKGTGFIPLRAVRTASPVRQTGVPARGVPVPCLEGVSWPR